MAFLDETGLAHFWNQILARLNKFVPAEAGKGLSTNDYTTEEKEKLAGIEVGANKTIVDSSLSSTSTNPVQNKIINTKFDSIQASIDSKVDKVTGKGLSTNDLTATLKANYNAAYTHSQQAHAPADAEKNVIVGVQKNGTDLAVNSSTRKVNITVPTKTSELTNDSSFVTTTNLDGKVDKVDGKGLSTNDYTTDEKTKLASIEEGANKTVVDTALSSTSTNPVQNKVINTKLTTMQSDIDSKVPSTRTVNGKALSANITLSASDVGALPSTTVIPSIDGFASETYVDNKVAELVDSAPATLNTLNELAAALGDDPNFATTVSTQIGNKVDKVDGKGLSTNDYTTTEKTKLASIAEGAQVNQNAFSNVVVGTTTVAADSTTDTLTLVAGDNVTLTPNATSDSITIAATDTVYTHPSYTARTGVPTANQTPSFGGTFTISQPVSDSTGHITAINSRTVTIPSSAASTSANGLMTSTQVTKLNGIAEGAQVNQNAFSNVVVGSTTIAADSATDTLTLAAGNNVTITPDATNDKVTISAIDTVYTHPTYTSKSSGMYKITVDGTGHVSAATAITKDDITGLGIPAQDTTYSTATTTANGLMSSGDKSKLNGIASGAQVNQNAFSNITVGSTTVAADSTTDTLTLVAGNNVILTPDATNDKITIAATDTVYTHPTYTSKSSGLYKVTVDGTGHVSAATTVTKADITGLGIPAQDTTYSTGNSTTAGITKLYTGTGTATDGTMTQSAITSALDELANNSDVFIAEYGVTSNAEIEAAFQAGKAVFVFDGAVMAPLTDWEGPTEHIFSNKDWQYKCADDTWTSEKAITLAKIGAAAEENGQYVVTTAGTGAAYTATVPGITSLTAGASFIMVPHTASTSTAPTLNVNGLGAKTIKRRISSIATTLQSGYTSSWLASGKPFRVIYDGTYWITDGHDKPVAADLYGTLAISKGGTGATTAADARTNLGAAPAYTYGTEDLVAGTSELATGTLYFVYE